MFWLMLFDLKSCYMLNRLWGCCWFSVVISLLVYNLFGVRIGSFNLMLNRLWGLVFSGCCLMGSMLFWNMILILIFIWVVLFLMISLVFFRFLVWIRCVCMFSGVMCVVMVVSFWLMVSSVLLCGVCYGRYIMLMFIDKCGMFCMKRLMVVFFFLWWRCCWWIFWVWWLVVGEWYLCGFYLWGFRFSKVLLLSWVI